jgi:hypothetical protein
VGCWCVKKCKKYKTRNGRFGIREKMDPRIAFGDFISAVIAHNVKTNETCSVGSHFVEKEIDKGVEVDEDLTDDYYKQNLSDLLPESWTPDDDIIIFMKNGTYKYNKGRNIVKIFDYESSQMKKDRVLANIIKTVKKNGGCIIFDDNQNKIGNFVEYPSEMEFKENYRIKIGRFSYRMKNGKWEPGFVCESTN